MKEWQKYKVGVPAAKGFNQNCQHFSDVSHTTHVEHAMPILQTGAIRAGLVFDESKLNKQRVLVAWASPNTWGNGYRYGTSRFQFSFSELAKGKRCYWVEAIPYSVVACRILLTDKNHDAHLTPYEPEAGDGPWWYDSKHDRHYYNGLHCLEFMLECDLQISAATDFDFVNHHPDMCSIHRTSPSTCVESSLSQLDGAGLFLSRLIVTGTTLGSCKQFFVEGVKPKYPLKHALMGLANSILGFNAKFTGTVKANDEIASSLVRGALAEVTFNRRKSARKLAFMFETEEDFFESVARIVAEHVGIADWELLAKALA